MIREHDKVVLTCDVPEHGLKRGDMGTVVHIHPDAPAYSVDFMALDGQTIAVISPAKDHVRSVAPGDIRHAPAVESTA